MASNYFKFIEEIPKYKYAQGTKVSQKFKFAGSEFEFYMIFRQSINQLSTCFMIYLLKDYRANVKANLLSRISILGANNQKFHTHTIEADFTKSYDFSPINGALYFIKRDDILNTKGLLVGGTLRVQFEVELLENKNSPSKILTPIKNDNEMIIDDNIDPNEKVFEDYQSMLESSKHSDVLFVVGKDCEKKEFRLHKNILASRSEVFDEMLKVDGVEKRKKNRVEITDISVPVFEELIRYIYTGKIGVSNLEQNVEELFVAAAKYQLDILKNSAGRELASKLAIESVSKVLVLADRHNAQQLKVDCIKYITEHVKEVMQTEAWKVAIEPRVDLMVLLYRDIANWK